jgi:formylmethanofuran dehydrogenase subunit C
MPLQIANESTDRIGVDWGGVTPESLRGKSLAAVQRTRVVRGNREVELGELFRLAGDAAEMRWELEGDFTAVHRMGAGMSEGEIVVEGSVGRHTGAGMRGGRIEIRGDAGDRLGGEMHGGVIRIHGSAGDHVGAAYPGSRRGMSGGMMLVDGNAGGELGLRMRRGLIAVGGSVGTHLGRRMLAGSIFVFGGCAEHPGASMRRGTIGLFGNNRPTLLPSFRAGYRGPLPVLHLLEKHLHDEGFAVPRLRNLAGVIELFHGDLLEGGRGEILLPA